MATNPAYSSTQNSNQEVQLVDHISDHEIQDELSGGGGDGTNYGVGDGRRFSLRIENFIQGSPSANQFGLDEENGISWTRIQMEGSEQIMQVFPGSLLAVTKQGSGSTLPVGVQALLYTSALTNGAISCFSGWALASS
ncbi:hypothetical protein GH714_026244 [Hevea brasiliensis]|uniref:Uncharacterized protein n=1 Tax=Hevea brasiliensis TaxID=3981 RepID=A0A6A6LJG8_HEVBR|nr:hypothetical protein GH714_026244 [Hevea brasiliensis]